MTKGNGRLSFGPTSLSREYCPRCKDHAIFKYGKCVRRGCGYVLKLVRSRLEWKSPAETAAEYRRRQHANVMRARRAMKAKIEAECEKRKSDEG